MATKKKQNVITLFNNYCGEGYNFEEEKAMLEECNGREFSDEAVWDSIGEMEREDYGTYSRGRLEKTQNDDETLADANIWQLFRAYQKSLKTKISETIHHIELDYVTIQDRQQAINNYLNVHGRALFEDLLDNDSHPIVAAVTFMAMLEMIKTDELVFRQSELFGPIWIYRKKNNEEFADEMASETVFFSKDPDVKPGLVEEIRKEATARKETGSVGDIAAVMREVLLWTDRGQIVTEEILDAMLEGREDLSEVQEDPYGDKDDETAEAVATAATEIHEDPALDPSSSAQDDNKVTAQDDTSEDESDTLEIHGAQD